MLSKWVLSEDPQLTLAMLQEKNSLILIVENSTKAEKIDLAKFWKDYSVRRGPQSWLVQDQQLLESMSTAVSAKVQTTDLLRAWPFGRNNGRESGTEIGIRWGDFVVPPPPQLSRAVKAGEINSRAHSTLRLCSTIQNNWEARTFVPASFDIRDDFLTDSDREPKACPFEVYCTQDQ